MERNYKLLLASFVGGSLIAVLPVTMAPLGLSSVLGLGMVSAAMLGSSTLGTVAVGSTVIGSSSVGTSIASAYSGALALGQVLVSLTAIGVLIFTEIADASYGHVRATVGEMRKGWMPVAFLMVILFVIIVAVRVLAIIK